MGIENLPGIIKFLGLKAVAQDRLDGQGLRLVYDPDAPETPTLQEVLDEEANYLADKAVVDAEDTDGTSARTTLLAQAAQSVTDMTNAIADVDAYLGDTPLNNTADEVRTQVRDLCVIVKALCQASREQTRVLRHIIKRGKV